MFESKAPFLIVVAAFCFVVSFFLPKQPTKTKLAEKLDWLGMNLSPRTKLRAVGFLAVILIPLLYLADRFG